MLYCVHSVPNFIGTLLKKNFPLLRCSSRYASCLHKLRAIWGTDITSMYRVKICMVCIKALCLKELPYDLMVLLEKSMRGNQIFSKSKRKALPKQILESRRNNFSLITVPETKSTRIINMEQIIAPFSISQFQSFEHNLDYGWHVTYSSKKL